MAGADGEPKAASTSSHMLKTTTNGRTFTEDTFEVFAALMLSLQLGPHKGSGFFTNTYPQSFTTDEAAQSLASLKISRVATKQPDPSDSTKTITTRLHITYSMTNTVAKAMCQRFMDACLIKSAVDSASFLFKDAGIYQLTPKGLHVLHRFISKNAINADHLQSLFNYLPMCSNLLRLERLDENDQIVVSQDAITAVFRLFAGRQPTYALPADKDLGPFQKHNKWAKGVSFSLARNKDVVYDYCFTAMDALAWLCNFTSVVGREEAAQLAAYFVSYGWITLLSDMRKSDERAIIFNVGNDLPPRVEFPATDRRVGQFRCSPKVIYRVTEEGGRVAGWSSRVLSVLRDVSNGEFVVERPSISVSRDSCGTMGDGEDAWVKVEARASLMLVP